MSSKKITEATVDAWLETEDADSSVIEALQGDVEKNEKRQLRKKLQQSEKLNEELKARIHQLELEVERLQYTQEENARLNEQIDKLTADNGQSLNSQVEKILEELPLLRSSFSSGLLGLKEEISSLKSAQQSHNSSLSRGFDSVNNLLNNIALNSVSEEERFLFEGDSLSSPAAVTGKKRGNSSKGKEPKSKRRKTHAEAASEENAEDSEGPSESDDSNRHDDADDTDEQSTRDEQEVVVRKKKQPAKRGRPKKSTTHEKKQQEEKDNSQAETDNEEEEEGEGDSSRTTRSRARQSLKNEAELKKRGSQKSAMIKGLKVGDCVSVRAAKGPDYIGVVTDLKEIKKGEPTVVEVTWFYRNKDVIKRGKELGLSLNTTLSNDDRELYLSNHADDNKVSAIVKRVQVIRVNKRQDNASERKLWLSLDPDHYYYTRKYNSKTHTFFPLD
eukprot:TRINITY_DN1377_c0_g1_i1.p1 TRINITY_DN1377_c0_g1~~TRINITY_DN1377_c0_g1_i1.p1  ORF type:complete len:470 (+),score=211.55 TRINITY_DN1377_c0_g1_i1:77-1411(+)